MTRTLTPAEESALVVVLGRAERLRKIGFAVGVVLVASMVAFSAWMARLMFQNGADSGELMAMAFGGLAIALFVGYLVSVWKHVFTSTEETIRDSKLLLGLEGSFEPISVLGGEGFSEIVLAISGLPVAVPAHWPQIPPSGTALVFVAARSVSNNVVPSSPPRVIEIVGWRSLDADIRDRRLPKSRLRFRTKPVRRPAAAADGDLNRP